MLDEKVPVFSFIYGIPPKEILEECRAKHIVTIGTATTPEEGAALQEAGVDAIVASGFEAGGHRGSFLRAAEDSLTGTFSLVPQIADMVNVPVIAAGGIADARGVIAALALGAEAVQMGTVFLACEESGASLLHRQALRGKNAGHTALTKGFTGKTRAGNPQPIDGGVEPKRELRSYHIHCNEDSSETSRSRQRRRADRISCPYGLGKVPIFLPAPTYRLS